MTQFFSNYVPPNQKVWQGREDGLAQARYFQRVRCLSINEAPLPDNQDPVLIGFACDEGVRRNQGRVGAQQGPDAIRTCLAKLACQHERSFLDLGDIHCQDLGLENAQDQLAELVSHAHKNGHNTILLGGGHEIAWPHFKGLSAHYSKLAIINIDAHFDMRPLEANGLGNSGTPFTQIANLCQENQLPFAYCCLGIQAQSNTFELFEIAREHQVTYLTAEDINEKSLAWQTAVLDDFMLSYNHIYVSICMDAFSEAYAPGVSAPQSLGIVPWQALALLKYIVQTGKVVALDIAELSPERDQDSKTARLAASLIAKLLEENLFPK